VKVVIALVILFVLAGCHSCPEQPGLPGPFYETSSGLAGTYRNLAGDRQIILVRDMNITGYRLTVYGPDTPGGKSYAMMVRQFGEPGVGPRAYEVELRRESTEAPGVFVYGRFETSGEAQPQTLTGRSIRSDWLERELAGMSGMVFERTDSLSPNSCAVKVTDERAFAAIIERAMSDPDALSEPEVWERVLFR
jgi:hypothetical protein